MLIMKPSSAKSSFLQEGRINVCRRIYLSSQRFPAFITSPVSLYLPFLKSKLLEVILARSSLNSSPSAKPAIPAHKRKIPAIKEFGFSTNFSDIYTFGELLGSGTFGAVFVCISKKTGQKYAAKLIKKKFMGAVLQEHFVRRIQHEVDVFNHLGRSLNIASLYGTYEDPNSVVLVMELCSGGELWEAVKRGGYSEADAARVMREVLCAIAQAHARHVVLRDVKPENFLFLNSSPNSPLKMIDFGLADYCQPGEYLTERAGTPVYVAPEVLRRQYGPPADLWSCGILAYMLLSARLPFEGGDSSLLASDLRLSARALSNKDIFAAILYAPLDFSRSPWDSVSAPAIDFVKRLLERDPVERMTAGEALEHPWLQVATETSSSCPFEDTIVQRLQRFGTYGKLKQVALAAVAQHAVREGYVMGGMRAALEAADVGGSGKLSYGEVEQILLSSRFDLSEVEVAQLLSTLDPGKDGQVDYYSWLAALVDWTELQGSEQWEAWVERVFATYDAKGVGMLTGSELTTMLCGDQCEIADTVPAALRDADGDDDGRISLAEWRSFLMADKEDELGLYSSRTKGR